MSTFDLYISYLSYCLQLKVYCIDMKAGGSQLFFNPDELSEQVSVAQNLNCAVAF